MLVRLCGCGWAREGYSAGIALAAAAGITITHAAVITHGPRRDVATWQARAQGVQCARLCEHMFRMCVIAVPVWLCRCVCVGHALLPVAAALCMVAVVVVLLLERQH